MSVSVALAALCGFGLGLRGGLFSVLLGALFVAALIGMLGFGIGQALLASFALQIAALVSMILRHGGRMETAPDTRPAKAGSKTARKRPAHAMRPH